MTTTIRRSAAGAHLAALRLIERGEPGRTASGRRGERGDVPGWVLITLMTAGLVSALWLVAEPQLTTLFRNALSSVTNP